MTFEKFASHFRLSEKYFDYPQGIHGVGHTYRVMMMCYYLGSYLKNESLTRLAIAASFVHDMARRHDGYCTEHGQWAAETKVPLFIDLFLKAGLTENDIILIKKAITNHSLMEEYKSDNSAYLLTAVLKDADALDRIRLSSSNLNPEFLRLQHSHTMIPFASNFYEKYQTIKFRSFTEVLSKAKLIYQNIEKDD